MGGATSPLPALRNLGEATSSLPTSALTHPQPETAQNTKINPFAKIAQYRNQIFTLLGVPPLNFNFHYLP